jgi:magnesium transporter
MADDREQDEQDRPEPPVEASDAGSRTEPADRVANRLDDIHATDGAAVMEHLSPERAADVAEYLDPQTAGRILAEMEPSAAAQVIEDMEAPEASMVLAAMDPDDRVDVLARIAKPLHDEIVREMDAADAAEVHRLEQYPPDTAGGIMTTQVTALTEHLTVEEAVDELRRMSEELEQMFYVYVVDGRRHLVGVLSMRDLILAKPGTPISRIMRGEVARVPATMDQEEVARIMRRYDYLAMPVVDDQNRLIGIITVDDVVDVLEEEATEDVQRMFGAGAEERLLSPWHFSFRKRWWWLVVNLGTAFLAGWVVSLFDGTLQKLTILAVYMPIVAGMGGNASAQAMSVAIRGLAVGKVDRGALWRVIYRESLVGLFTGVLIGLITATIALTWQRNAALGLVIGMALVINHTLACVTGATIPFVMKRLGFDPAQSATIFATTVTDVAGFFSLLGLAWVFIKYLI